MESGWEIWIVVGNVVSDSQNIGFSRKLWDVAERYDGGELCIVRGKNIRHVTGKYIGPLICLL